MKITQFNIEIATICEIMCEEGSESKFVSEEGLNVFWTMPRTNLTPATLRNIKTRTDLRIASGPIIISTGTLQSKIRDKTTLMTLF